MKEEFLKELEKRLIEENIADVDSIIAKYEKRYNFGIESGLSDEEILKMLGSIDEIVNLHKCETRYEYKESFGKMKLSVSTVSDNVNFERSKDDTVHVYFQNIDESSYDIDKSPNEISISYINKKFFGLNRRRPGLITVAIPDNMSFYRVNLSTVSGDFNSPIGIDSEYISIDVVSGDSEFKRLKTNDFKCHVVSGDLEVSELNTNTVELSSVSGDVEIEVLKADELKVSTISGDIDIKEAYESMRVSSSSISGSIKINEKKYKNFEDRMEEF